MRLTSGQYSLSRLLNNDWLIKSLEAPALISVSWTVDAIIGNQAFQNGRCHICFSLSLDKVETGYNLLME